MDDQPLGRYEDFDLPGVKNPEEKAREANEKAAILLEKAFAERNDFINELANGGGPVIRSILENFTARIDKLISEDPECLAYKKCMGTMYEKMQVGSQIARRIAKLFGIEGAPKT